MTSPPRTDMRLVEAGLARSRSEARRLLDAGLIRARLESGEVLRPKASSRLPMGAVLECVNDQALRYVSRGAWKLAAALAQFRVDPGGWICADIGQSTGGFSDCLIQAGAMAVVGVDVGHAQLHPTLRADPRVFCFEGLHVANCSTALLSGKLPMDLATRVRSQGFDCVVADLSFISQRQVLHVLAELTGASGDLITLVKPQFELGPGAVNRKGLVIDPTRLTPLRDQFAMALGDCGMALIDWCDSPITGGDGNREFLLHARHQQAD